MHAKLLQSCPTLCDFMNCNPPGSSVHGILQARILESVAMPSSSWSSLLWDWTQVLMFPALAGRFFTTSTTWDAQYIPLLVYNQDVSRTGLLRGLWEKELLQASLLGLQKALFLYTYLCPIHSHHLVLLPLPSTIKHYINSGLNMKTQYIKHSLAMIVSEVKAPACNAEDPGVIPGLGRSPGEGNGNPLQYSCLENPMRGGAW